MAAGKTNTTSEFMSDHPSDETRIRQIQGWMPEALKYYKKGGTTTTTSAKSTAQPTTTTKTFHISTKKK
jgi:hypothetical protein